MGMFDTIRVDAPLPLPELAGRTFQTKSLDCMLNIYRITADGKLIQTWKNDKGYQCSAPIPFHGVILFYTFRDTVAATGWVEFRAVFTHGQLYRIDLISYRERVAYE